MAILFVGVVGVAQVASAGPTTTATTVAPTTTTSPPPTEPPPTSPPPTEPPPPPVRPTTTRPRTTTTRPPATTAAPTTATTTPTTAPATTTTAAPAVVVPGNTTTVPPTEGDGDSGGSGPSSGRQLALVVGGLVAVAGGLATLTFLYWRHTRPAAYNTALDAATDLGGPVPVVEAGVGPVVAGEPTVVTPSSLTTTAAVPTRSPEHRAALLAALVAAEEAGTRRSASGAETEADPELDPRSGGEAVGDAVGPAPIRPGEPGVRIIGPVVATAATVATAGAAPGQGEGQSADGPDHPPTEGEQSGGAGGSVDTSAGDAVVAASVASADSWAEAPVLRTREDLEAPSPPAAVPAATEPAASDDPLDPLVRLLREQETEVSSPPVAGGGPGTDV